MKDITPEELRNRLAKSEKLTILDVREEWEYEEQNIGAQLLPLPSIPVKLAELSSLKEEEIIVHCKSGTRSLQAKKFLTQHGFSKVRSLEGGIEEFLGKE